MNYTSELAKEIINRCGLSASVEKVWKTRNSIPDKYADPDFKPPVKIDKAGEILQDRILKVVESGYLNAPLILQLANVPWAKFQDIKRGKSNFSETEVIAMKKEINKARIMIIKTFERKTNSALQSLLQSEALQIWPIFKAAQLDKNTYDRTSKFKITGIQLSDPDYQLVKDALIRCAITLSL